jgi:hypothetical protein
MLCCDSPPNLHIPPLVARPGLAPSMGAEARHNIQLDGGATDAQVLCFDPIVQWIDQVMKCFMIVTWRLDMPQRK